jgi:hypothetical protein
VYLQAVEVLEFTGRTNGDLVYHVLDLRKALELANRDKALLRIWVGLVNEGTSGD